MIKMTAAGDYFSEDNNFGILVQHDAPQPYQVAAMDVGYAFRTFDIHNERKDVVSHNLEGLEELMGFLNQVIYAEKQRLRIND